MNIANSPGISRSYCVQVRETEDGNSLFVESNARLGGGTIFTALAEPYIQPLMIYLVGRD